MKLIQTVLNLSRFNRDKPLLLKTGGARDLFRHVVESNLGEPAAPGPTLSPDLRPSDDAMMPHPGRRRAAFWARRGTRSS